MAGAGRFGRGVLLTRAPFVKSLGGLRASSRAVVCQEFGGPEVLKIGEKRLGEPGPGQLLIRMGAAGVNPSDTYVRLGPKGPWAATPHLLPEPPFTPGKDGAGVVHAMGVGVPETLRPGARVYTLGSVSGTYAEFALCNVKDVFPLPDTVSLAMGACVGVPCSTAYRALVLRGNAKKGESVFVHGASGAVGLAAVQMAAHLGCFVVGSAGTTEGEAAIAKAGAHAVVNHRMEGYLEAATAALPQNCGGFNLCLEMMASSNLVKDLSVMARHGRVAIIGSKAEPIAFNPRLTMPLELQIQGVFSPSATPLETETTQAALFTAMQEGALTPVVGLELPLEEAPQAHVEIMKPSLGGAVGNIVLRCGDVE